MSGKVLLLDVDGVVLHQPRLLNYVSRKIVSYVREVSPYHLSFEQAKDLNEVLYKSFGHTQRGLQKIYGQQCPTLPVFQNKIYDQSTIHHLWSYRNDPTIQQRGYAVLELLDEAAKKGVPVYLFSNSPIQWCQCIADMLYLDIPSDHILCTSHPVFQDNLLKPDVKLYENVATFLQQSHRDKGITQYVFVDDSWINLAPVIGGSAWYPICLAEDGPFITSKRVHTVCTLRDVVRELD